MHAPNVGLTRSTWNAGILHGLQRPLQAPQALGSTSNPASVTAHLVNPIPQPASEEK